MKAKLHLKFNKFKADFLHAMYPHTCIVCETETMYSASSLCPICASELVYTTFEKYEKDSPLDRVFWGRIPIENTFALLYFTGTNSTRVILHHLKYKDRSDLAVHMGKQIGQTIKHLSAFSEIEALVPVPLHPKKQFLRGYNQAERIANGISTEMGIPLASDLLSRSVFTESQTKKNKLSRWENMQNRFVSKRTKTNTFQHIALVDDVVTTGATLETCVRILRAEYPELKISIISLAYAQ